MDKKMFEGRDKKAQEIAKVNHRIADEFRKIMETHARTTTAATRIAEDHERALEQVRLFTKPIEAVMKGIQLNTGIQHMLREVEQRRTLLHMALGPLAELRQAGLLDSLSPLHEEFQKTHKLMADFQARFRLPHVEETARLLSGMKLNPLLEEFKRHEKQMAGLRQTLESIRAPWLDAQDALRSITGAAQIQGIGQIVAQLPVFDDWASTALRVGLGDWRDRIAWPEEIFVNLEARSAFYLERGFDTSLTDFPAPAFQETVQIAGLRRDPPPTAEMYGPPILPAEDDDEEEALRRTNDAHDVLMRLEMQIRRFIDDKMTEAQGPNWTKHRLPQDVRENWENKKRAAEAMGAESRPLIAYADFTDYEKVLCRGDNWREVFVAFFKRPENVRETFQRLYPLRLDTMHARPITQEDELFLYVETRRLVKVILPGEG